MAHTPGLQIHFPGASAPHPGPTAGDAVSVVWLGHRTRGVLIVDQGQTRAIYTCSYVVCISDGLKITLPLL